AGANAVGVSGSPVSLPAWLKLVRSGSNFSGYVSGDAVNWIQIGAITNIAMSPTADAGLALGNGSSTAVTTTTFDNVIASNDFILSVSPKAVISGSSIQYTVNVNALSGFSGSVSLSVSGLPSGATSSFSPSSLSSGNSVLTVTPAANTPANSYPLVITGASGAVTHTAAVKLIGTGSPFSLWTDLDVGNVGAAGGVSFNGTIFN